VLAVIGSAALWSAAIAVFALHHGPMLIRRRLDGKPG
jgi:uncharacterized protein involved in response to NO